MEKDDLEIADTVDDLIRRGYIDHTMREVWIKKMKEKQKKVLDNATENDNINYR